MSNITIYEDQENRVPLSLHERGLQKHGDTNVGVQLGQNLLNQKLTLQNRRPVLSSLSINNSTSIRVQPRRAAKQGVSYDSGCPQQVTDENAPPKVSNSLSNASTTLPSFTIHEDSESCVPSKSSSSFPLWQNVSSKSSNSSSSDASSVATMSSSSSSISMQIRPKLREIKPDLALSPVKNRIRGKSKFTELRSSKISSQINSPEDMDISLTDNVMAVDTTPFVMSLPREDILERKDLDFWDVPEYSSDIYNYLREAEICHKPRPNYMLKQTDITASMRWILVDWLVEVSEEYSLHTETLYLAVSYIDRFLSQMSVKRDKLQLVGTTAMFIASKYEEIYPPDVSQFAYITDNTYRVGQILRMEHLILKVLSFDMAVPTALLFLNYYTKLSKCSEETSHLAMFVAELSMLDSDPFLRFLPSVIAASSVALANFTQGKEAWSSELSNMTRYCLDDLRECYVNLHRSFCRVNEPTQHAIRDKYKAAKWHSVSLLSPRDRFPW